MLYSHGRSFFTERQMRSAEILVRVQTLVARGRIRILRHASGRMALRGYTLPEIEQVLLNGIHEVERDECDSVFDQWTHAICVMVEGRALSW